MGCRKISKTEYFLRLLFPVRCICCDMVLPINVLQELCGDCEKSLTLLKEFEHESAPDSYISKIYSVFDYEGGIRKAVHRLKFSESPHNAAVLVDVSYPLLKNLLNEHSSCMPYTKYDIIIPVPLHPKRKRQRGYNQSELLASRLAFYMKIPMLKGVLVKTVNAPPQSQLTRGERIRNLIGVFHVKKPNLVKQRRILLVDDIMTTGSTLEQCAKALADAGAIKIDAYVVALRRRL